MRGNLEDNRRLENETRTMLHAKETYKDIERDTEPTTHKRRWVWGSEGQDKEVMSDGR